MDKNIFDNLIYLVSFVIAVTTHEFAHAYAAFKLGDPTAKMNGRLTLNPLAHVDPMGLIFMLLFKVGWAKGVPINPWFFKKRKRDSIIVSIAGIITNFAIAIIASIIFKNVTIQWSIFYKGLFILAYVNVMLGIFNLMPLPPLDGSKILISIMPERLEFFLIRNEKIFYIVLVLLVVTNKIGDVILPIIFKVVEVLFF